MSGGRREGGRGREHLCFARRNERAVNPIVPLNAVVTYAGSKLLTNSRLKFVARERKCARQLRREAIAHSFGLREWICFRGPSNKNLWNGRNGYISVISFFLAHFGKKYSAFAIIDDLKLFRKFTAHFKFHVRLFPSSSLSPLAFSIIIIFHSIFSNAKCTIVDICNVCTIKYLFADGAYRMWWKIHHADTALPLFLSVAVIFLNDNTESDSAWNRVMRTVFDWRYKV